MKYFSGSLSSFTEFVRLPSVLGCYAGFPKVRIHAARAMRKRGKIRVEFDGMLKKRNCGGGPVCCS